MTLRGLKARVFRGAPPWLFRWHDAYVAELRRVPEAALRGQRLQVRWAQPQDMTLLVRVRPKESAFAMHFRHGDRCALGFLGDVPVSMNWLSGNRRHHSRSNHFTFDCGEDGAWSSEDFVHPDHRRRGYFASHLAGLMDLLARERVQRLYCAMIADDRRSLGAHERAGYHLMYRIRTIRLAGATVHRVRDLRTERTSHFLGAWRGSGAS